MRPVVPLAGYDAIVFDCDGVLLDSNGMKTTAFAQVVREAGFAPEVAQRFSEHQQRNFGVSRHRLFAALLAGEFGPVPADCTLEALLQAFGRTSLAGYLQAPFTEGAEALLEALVGRPLYVVSGSDETELREVFHQRGLSRRFRQVFGSPSTKAANVQRVRADLAAAGLPTQRVVFLGDAHADADAARDERCEFVFVANYSTVRPSMTERVAREGLSTVHSLAELLTL